MAKKSAGIRERFESFKQHRSREYYQLRLRYDLAYLMEKGLLAKGMTQAALAKAADTSEAYISRLINSETNCKLEAVAQALVPLGIIPKIVDSADWDRLNRLSDQSTGPAFTDTQRTDTYVRTSTTIISSGSEATERVVYWGKEGGVPGQHRAPNVVGRPFAALRA